MKKFGKSIRGILAVALVASTLSFSGVLQTATIAGSDIRDNFTFPESIDKTGTVGEKTAVARIMPSVADATGYKYKVLFDPTGEEVATDGYSFLPEKAGIYKCIYYYETVDDTACEYSYFVNVTAADGPVFEEAPVLPTAFVAGAIYQLPEVAAADWSSGAKQVASVTATVTINGQEMSVSADGSVEIDTQGFSTAEVVYTATVGGKAQTYTANVPVVDIRTTVMDDGKEKSVIDTSALFITRGFDESATYYEAEKVAGLSFFAVGDAQANFVNTLGSEGLSIEFGFGTACGAESILYTIESYEDPTVQLTLEFKKGKQDEGLGEVILNGEKAVAHQFTTEKSISVTFNEAKSSFTCNGEALFDVATDAKGGEFTGFAGGKVKISLAVKDSYGETELRIYKINMQRMGVTRDNGDPDVFIENVKREYSVGEEIKLFDRFAVDVIDPCATVKTSVTFNSQPVNDINGKPITNVLNDAEVVFKAEKAGTYTVLCIVEDSAGRIMNRVNLLTVYDNAAPTLTIDGSVTDSVSVGASTTLPKAVAEDNDGTENTRVQVCVIWPTGKMKQIMLGNGSVEKTKFDQFTVSGVYTVRYIATDASGNQTMEEFKIECGG